jgi:hypothetical protein
MCGLIIWLLGGMIPVSAFVRLESGESNFNREVFIASGWCYIW